MAYKAFGFVRDVTVDTNGMTFHLDVQIADGTRHYSLTWGPVDENSLTVTLQGGLSSWVKSYASGTMGQSFGLLDTARIINADLIP